MRTFAIHLTFLSASLGLLAACDDRGTIEEETPMADTLRSGAAVAYAEVYRATSYSAGFGVSREWLPRDLAVHPAGELWVVQQMERNPAFDDETECTGRGISGDPNDCVSLQGSTVAIREPANLEAATPENGRANLVVDANSLHFMRRPSGIAFGVSELPFEPTDPGGEEAGVTETIIFTDTFATCHEHWTANTTDSQPFIGPSLWTADPAIYNGVNGSFDWSNGSHLDMVHATRYCMGIAHERDNVYWTFNGHHGVLDRYDFQAPHYPGHYDHDDGEVTRYFMPEDDSLVRLPYVPSNMVVDGTDLFVADTGNGRVLRFDIASEVTEFGTFRTYELLEAQAMDNIFYEEVLDAETLSAEWGGAAEPSGLALLDADTLVVANHGTGHISLYQRDGTPIRTLDTGTGPGLGGLTVLGDAIYFVQMNERRIYRIDVVPSP